MPLVAADVACMLMATALVLPMTPALGSFYGGLAFLPHNVAFTPLGAGETEQVENHRGTTVKMELSEKVQGKVGDGKVFVVPVEKVCGIRTGEEDQAAVTPVAIPEMV